MLKFQISEREGFLADQMRENEEIKKKIVFGERRVFKLRYIFCDFFLIRFMNTSRESYQSSQADLTIIQDEVEVLRTTLNKCNLVTLIDFS